MGTTCCTNRAKRDAYWVLLRKAEGKKSLRRPRSKRMNNVKITIRQDIVTGILEFVHRLGLKIRTRRFGNCICFHSQVKGGRRLLCWVPVITSEIHHRQYTPDSEIRVAWTGIVWLRIGAIGQGCCEHGNEPSVP
jgi:hypothetical protein